MCPRFGANSEYAPLRKVLVRRPGVEIDHIDVPEGALFQKPVAPDIARRQHDAMSLYLRTAGIEVEYLYTEVYSKPNLYFCRDLVLVTASGLVICRPTATVRSGEELIARKALEARGIPAAFRIQSPGYLEGGDVCLATPELAIIGIGGRTNEEGARQLRDFLRAEGFGEIHTIKLPKSVLHLDMIMAMLDRHLAAISDRDTPPALLDVLNCHNIATVSLPHEEAIDGMALNLLCLGPRSIIAPSGNTLSMERLRRAGVSCTEVEISELMKGGGAIHCMTAVIARDFMSAS
jgi:N-dimethylarginine dimethylaminohydrolase